LHGTFFEKCLKDVDRFRLDALVATHRAIWLERCRPGGLDDSVAKLRKIEGPDAVA